MKRRKMGIFLAFLALNVYGQEKGLKLNDLTRQALERNPKIQSLRNLAEAEKFRVAPEGALPDPVLGFSLKNMGLDKITVGEEVMSEVGFSVSQTIPFPGKLRLKSAIAATRALRAEERLKAFELSLAREIKELYAKLFYYHKARDFWLQKKDVLKKALEIAETKYAVGQGIQSDIFKAQVEISRADEMLLTMQQMIRAGEANINSLLDLPPENILGMPEEIPFYQISFELQQLVDESKRNSPLLKGAGLMIEESDKEVKMARKEFYPNFMITAGKGFKGALPDMYEFMVGIEIPLYFKKKQARLLEESVARLSSSRNEYVSMKNEIEFMLTENFTMAKTSENLARLYKERILPQARFSYESSLANYQVNRVDFLMLLSDIDGLFTYEMDYFKNLSQLWSSVARIEELASMEIIK